jgi:uncharacterized membrane-anchored protein
VSPKLTRLALALPLLVIAIAIARAELFVRDAAVLSLPITGYDPRDLLQGHYLQFQLVLDPEHTEEREACDVSQQECCWCLTPVQDAPSSRAERATCRTARELCEGALTLTAASKPYRFYVPETHAASMERELIEARTAGDAYATFAIDQEGAARVIELRLRGKRYSSLPSRGSR